MTKRKITTITNSVFASYRVNFCLFRDEAECARKYLARDDIIPLIVEKEFKLANCDWLGKLQKLSCFLKNQPVLINLNSILGEMGENCPFMIFAIILKPRSALTRYFLISCIKYCNNISFIYPYLNGSLQLF